MAQLQRLWPIGCRHRRLSPTGEQSRLSSLVVRRRHSCSGGVEVAAAGTAAAAATAALALLFALVLNGVALPGARAECPIRTPLLALAAAVGLRATVADRISLQQHPYSDAYGQPRPTPSEGRLLQRQRRRRLDDTTQSFPGDDIADFSVTGGFVLSVENNDNSSNWGSRGFFMMAELGTPAQRFNLRIDTTAVLPWVQCECQDCGLLEDGTYFNAFLSSTIDMPRCNTDECFYADKVINEQPTFQMATGCVNGSEDSLPLGATSLPKANPYCAYNLSQIDAITGDIHASSEGNLVLDWLNYRSFDGSTIYGVVAFGCGGFQSGAWYDMASEVPYGVAALAPAPNSFIGQTILVNNLADRLSGSYIYSPERTSILLCLQTGDEILQNNSRLWTGTTGFLPNVTGVQWANLKFQRNKYTLFVMNAATISITTGTAAKPVKLRPNLLPRFNVATGEGGMLVNTSEANLLLPQKAYNEVIKVVRAAHNDLTTIGHDSDVMAGNLCFDVQRYRKNLTAIYSDFGNITIHFAPGDGNDLVVPPEAYLYVDFSYNSVPVACIMMKLAPPEATYSTFGYMWMRGRLYLLHANDAKIWWKDEENCESVNIRDLVDTTVSPSPPPSPPPPPLVAATDVKAAIAARMLGAWLLWVPFMLAVAFAMMHMALSA